VQHLEARRTRCTGVPNYLYELRLDDTLVGTGHLSRDEPFGIGEHLSFEGRRGVVRWVSPQLISGELRVVVELTRQESG
jgi:hypothetical protein